MYKSFSNLSDSLLITLTGLPFICLAWWLNGSLIGIDDADIFFTYAENLAHGKGISYAKTIPPVEGYSSTLWMLLASFIFYAGYNELGVFIITCFLFLVTQFVSLKIFNIFFNKDHCLPKLIYLLIAITSFGYVSWTTITLMDATAWGLIIILLAYNFFKDPNSRVEWIVFSLPFILAPITRPEALLVIPGYLLIYGSYRRINSLNKKPIIIGFILFILSSALLTIFRYLYFGFFLPNTFYAKVSPSFIYNLKEGFSYLNNFIIDSPATLMSVFLIIIFTSYYLFKTINTQPNNNNLNHRTHLFYLSIFSIFLLLVPTINGGDHFNLYRFYQSYYPLFVICLILTHKSLLLMVSKNLACYFIFISCLMFFYILKINIFGANGWVNIYKNKSPIAHEFQISENGRILGNHLNNLFKDVTGGQPSIGVITAGGIARKYHGPIYDLMGLNNSYIAHYPGDRRGIKNHAAFEKDAFFNLPINIIVDSPDNGFVQIALKGLFQDPRFLDQWRFGTFFNIHDKKNQSFQGFFKKDYLKIALSDNNYVFLDSKVFDPLANKWVAIDK